MNEWDQRIREHAVWDTMSSLGRVIDDTLKIAGSDTTTAVGLERVRAALAFLGKRLAGADPFLSVTGPFDAINVCLSQAQDDLRAFSSGQDAAGIANANVRIDAALPRSLEVPAIATPEEMGAVIQSAVAFRTDFQSHLTEALKGELENRANSVALKGTLTELSELIQREREQLNLLIADYQRQFSEAQERRMQESGAALLQAQQELAKITADHQTQFSGAQETRAGEFLEATATSEKRVTELVAAHELRLSEQNAEFTTARTDLLTASRSAIDTLHTDYARKSQDVLDQIEAHRSRVEKLVGVIGNLGVTSGYLRAANHARYTMWAWQAITVAAMLSLSLMAYKTLYILGDAKGVFNWGGFAGRVVFLASLGVIAAYAGAQADKLFNSEKRNRRLALELEAIGPYLAPLPTEDQNRFRIQIGERSFGQEEVSASGDKSPATLMALASSKEVKGLLETLLDLVKKAKT